MKRVNDDLSRVSMSVAIDVPAHKAATRHHNYRPRAGRRWRVVCFATLSRPCDDPNAPLASVPVCLLDTLESSHQWVHHTALGERTE